MNSFETYVTDMKKYNISHMDKDTLAKVRDTSGALAVATGFIELLEPRSDLLAASFVLGGISLAAHMKLQQE